jgi:hypothetical protein
MPKGIGGTGELQLTVLSATVSINPLIERAISSSRLTTYRQAARDDSHAWELYRWNLDLVAAFAPLSADLEVTLRNTIHDQLTNHLGRADWWAAQALLLDDITAEMLIAAVGKRQQKIAKGTVGVGKVIADLTLGTWVNLLGRGGHSALGRSIDYETHIWRPALRFGFATGSFTASGRERRPTRDAAHTRAANFQRLRNRAAHHEPIFNGILQPGTSTRISLLDVWYECLELLSWMSPELAAIHRQAATLPTVHAGRP